jgi:acetyl-CoA/propionyl-CoA carboxylase biotin carboxyl carrier protein
VFRRVLIANRGEIAVRVIRACREMDIESVAVYSDADAGALHTTLADRAVRIGPAAAADSYLSTDAMLAAVRQTGADAVHPGYGFLSENERFATACADAGVVFIGPPADVIAGMGSKIAARQIAERAGVPVVPGEVPADQSDEAIAAAARRIGLPVIVKPSEGGGGIGMKTVRDAADLLPAISQARREALASFGDGTLYVERLVERPRHVEFQIIADTRGHVVHVFERECSIQRRHQKVVEETPSTALTPALRQRMGAAAVAIAKTSGYRNAGTVEFLLEGAGEAARFYFLEMNTRLQVEHPVTEQVACVDLVRAQIAVAAGEALPWTQEDLIQRGHAIEARIYAEDPARDHLPQAGPLLLYREPRGPGIRVDAGVTEGGEITVHYDPMIAKLIAHGESREAARQRLLAALRDYPILGIRTNVAFLIELLEHPRVVSGDIDTGFLDAEGGSLRAKLAGGPPPEAVAVAGAGPAVAGPHASAGSQDPFSDVGAGGSSTAGAGTSSDVGAGFSRPITDPWTTLRGWRG